MDSKQKATYTYLESGLIRRETYEYNSSEVKDGFIILYIDAEFSKALITFNMSYIVKVEYLYE